MARIAKIIRETICHKSVVNIFLAVVLLFAHQWVTRLLAPSAWNRIMKRSFVVFDGKLWKRKLTFPLWWRSLSAASCDSKNRFCSPWSLFGSPANSTSLFDLQCVSNSLKAASCDIVQFCISAIEHVLQIQFKGRAIELPGELVA